MWKKHEDVESGQSQSTSKPNDATRLLGDVLSQSPSINEEQRRNSVAASEEAPTAAPNQPGRSNQSAASNQPLTANHPVTPPTMTTYTEAVKEFTTNATAFIEHLPLLTKARAAYEEAMRASREMRKVLDTSDENLRTLMNQLDQHVDVRDMKGATEKKPPEAAKVERMKSAEEVGGRAFSWP